MGALVSTEDQLKERIKELTCLYNVSSYIANCNLYDLDPTFKAIAASLKAAILYNEEAFVEMKLGDTVVCAGQRLKDQVFILSAIKVFNLPFGSIKIGYSKEKYNQNVFLTEEKQLLKTVASEIGNLIERKQIIEKEELRKRQMERADRLAILGEITAGIAHELNTPLASILGFSELLKERFINDNNALQDLDKIMNSAIFSREVVKKLMFFSCEMPHHMQLVNINPIIIEAINLLKPNFSKKGLECRLAFNEDDIFLRVDAIQLTQVIFNLVINAIYFSPKNGIIDVNVSNQPKEVVLHISDEGKGIPKEISEHIFNPFYTTKPVGEGSGLGLSVVHGIMKSHRGTIKHSFNKPKGTVFTLTFPKI
ncbi:phospho-acceptor domain-containing protein [Gelidibacter sediminis]|uniref:histidine kinase n=1 Tax=Gelidibacter sediminis TaxID=1608710 RepID=A0A4R7PZ55_9FLAO|nr:HAMP domain-containing sensor histidine kinase [Gelidibacter sediminis]TDU40288.1 phospho-acceptor domain-containing protein [Gelidibacter sediminis]